MARAVLLTFTEALPQSAPDRVDGVKVRHLEQVCVLGLGGDLLQLHLERLSDANGEHSDTGLTGLSGRLQHVILTPAVRKQDGHPLGVPGQRPGPRALREDVFGGVADGLPGHGVSSPVDDVPSGPLDLVHGAVPVQLELYGGAVTVAHHRHAGLSGSYVKGLHQVGHPLADLLKVLLPHTGGRVQDEGQIVLDIFTS